MKRSFVVTLMLLALASIALFCSKGARSRSGVDSTNMKDQSSNRPTFSADSVFIAPDSIYSIHVPIGYAFNDVFHDGSQVEIGPSQHHTVTMYVLKLHPYDLARALELDKRDTIKGFAMARALSGPPLGNPDDEGSTQKIDSIYEFKNPFGLRCFRINCTYISFGLESKDSSFSPYECFFVDISRKDQGSLIQMLHMFEDSTYSDLCSSITRRISLGLIAE